jgi:hypothetical protein
MKATQQQPRQVRPDNTITCLRSEWMVISEHAVIPPATARYISWKAMRVTSLPYISTGANTLFGILQVILQIFLVAASFEDLYEPSTVATVAANAKE